MTIFKGLNDLELAEDYADAVGHPYNSEESVSEWFDLHMMPALIEAHGKPGVEFSDEAMISEAFNFWTDNLCTEGDLHPAQLKSYCYVGKWS